MLEAIPLAEDTWAGLASRILSWPVGLSLLALSRALAGLGAVSRSGRPFDPKALSRMLDAVADSSVKHTLAS
jgi:hypothetical protein